jgi:hypothetical protein
LPAGDAVGDVVGDPGGADSGGSDVFFARAPVSTRRHPPPHREEGTVVLPILHRRRASGPAAPPLVLAASLVVAASLALTGCSEGDTPSPAAGMTTAGATADGPSSSPSAGSTSADDAATDPTTGATTGRTTGSGTGKGPGAGNKAIGTPPTDQQQGGPKTIVMIVKGKTVSPKTGTFKVKKGEPVLLVVITDTDNELHIHGAEIEKPTKAGKPTQVPLTFDEVGSYEVELHDPELLLTKIVVS